MYRADLPRTLTLVVALLLNVAPTSLLAREFRVADTRNEDYPAVQALKSAQRSGQSMRDKWHDLEERSRARAEAAGVTIVKDFDRKPFEEAMRPLCEQVRRDAASAQLIDRIRRME